MNKYTIDCVYRDQYCTGVGSYLYTARSNALISFVKHLFVSLNGIFKDDECEFVLQRLYELVAARSSNRCLYCSNSTVRVVRLPL